MHPSQSLTRLVYNAHSLLDHRFFDLGASVMVQTVVLARQFQNILYTNLTLMANGMVWRERCAGDHARQRLFAEHQCRIARPR